MVVLDSWTISRLGSGASRTSGSRILVGAHHRGPPQILLGAAEEMIARLRSRTDERQASQSCCSCCLP